MPAGLINLVARGVQDLYLTSHPQITFFKVVYRRHTNFAIESVIQSFSFAVNFGNTSVCILSRVGDLVHKIYLYVEVPDIPKFYNPYTGKEDTIKKFAWVKNLGYALINEVSIEIGGKLIDKQYGEWLYIWSQVSNKQTTALNKMIGNIPEIYEFTNGKSGYKLFIPLEFWFCRHIGLSLPLVALSNSDVKIVISFRKLEECYRIGPTHSIEINEDLISFKPGDYIEQTINRQTIYGYVINYDYLQKKLYYIKIHNKSATKRSFESSPDKLTGYKINSLPYDNNYNQETDCYYNWENNDTPFFLNNSDNLDDSENLFNSDNSFRIYHCTTRDYCTPKPGALEKNECITLFPKPMITEACLYVDYIYLDNNERANFVKSNIEYLIEQVQFNQVIGVNSKVFKQNLALKHPCKAHYWIAQLNGMVGYGTINDLFNYTSSYIDNPSSKRQSLIKSAKLVLNERDRFSERTVEYFNLIVPYAHHYRAPDVGINIYSISIYPENHQPSSTINMSKIDHAKMQMKLDTIVSPQNQINIRSYTINYNILRILCNLGGLAFE